MFSQSNVKATVLDGYAYLTDRTGGNDHRTSRLSPVITNSTTARLMISLLFRLPVSLLPSFSFFFFFKVVR